MTEETHQAPECTETETDKQTKDKIVMVKTDCQVDRTWVTEETSLTLTTNLTQLRVSWKRVLNWELTQIRLTCGHVLGIV